MTIERYIGTTGRSIDKSTLFREISERTDKKKVIDMVTYIALLRGINVGRNNRIKMAELQRLFNELQLARVRTYVQSGNVLFESREQEEKLRTKIEKHIGERLGFPVATILRNEEELRKLIENCPFSKDAVQKARSSSDVEVLYVALLAWPPPTRSLEILDSYQDEGSERSIVGRDIYLLLHRGVRDSKTVNNLPRLGVPHTMRNWRTLNYLNDLVKEG